MQTLSIITRLTFNEFSTSEFLASNAENFGREHLVKSELSRWEKYNAVFYVVKADAANNYGLDFNIWISYTADGINFFKKFNLGMACLSSDGVRIVRFYGNEIGFSKESYRKDGEHRKGLRLMSDKGYIFC